MLKGVSQSPIGAVSGPDLTGATRQIDAFYDGINDIVASSTEAVQDFAIKRILQNQDTTARKRFGDAVLSSNSELLEVYNQQGSAAEDTIEQGRSILDRNKEIGLKGLDGPTALLFSQRYDQHVYNQSQRLYEHDFNQKEVVYHESYDREREGYLSDVMHEALRESGNYIKEDGPTRASGTAGEIGTRIGRTGDAPLSRAANDDPDIDLPDSFTEGGERSVIRAPGAENESIDGGPTPRTDQIIDNIVFTFESEFQGEGAESIEAKAKLFVSDAHLLAIDALMANGRMIEASAYAADHEKQIVDKDYLEIQKSLKPATDTERAIDTVAKARAAAPDDRKAQLKWLRSNVPKTERDAAIARWRGNNVLDDELDGQVRDAETKQRWASIVLLTQDGATREQFEEATKISNTEPNPSRSLRMSQKIAAARTGKFVVSDPAVRNSLLEFEVAWSNGDKTVIGPHGERTFADIIPDEYTDLSEKHREALRKDVEKAKRGEDLPTGRAMKAGVLEYEKATNKKKPEIGKRGYETYSVYIAEFMDIVEQHNKKPGNIEPTNDDMRKFAAQAQIQVSVTTEHNLIFSDKKKILSIDDLSDVDKANVRLPDAKTSVRLERAILDNSYEVYKKDQAELGKPVLSKQFFEFDLSHEQRLRIGEIVIEDYVKELEEKRANLGR